MKKKLIFYVSSCSGGTEKNKDFVIWGRSSRHRHEVSEYVQDCRKKPYCKKCDAKIHKIEFFREIKPNELY